MRKIPVAMATQHPDSASKYVPVQEEPLEAIENFNLGCDEQMVDYEGKLTPYHQTSQIVLEALTRGIKVGEDVFVTPRVPSATKENVFRQLMALLSVLEAQFMAREYTSQPVVYEIIHPMVESAEELISAKKRLDEIIKLGKKELNLKINEEDFGIIPLVEEVPELIKIGDIISKYMQNVKPKYLRVLIGRSDPALCYGLVPAVLSCKLAISECCRFDNVFPILGAGSLPFRGHVTPDNIENVLWEYSGIRTLTIQSALRYDYGKHEAKKVIKIIKKKISKKPLNFTKEEKDEIIEIIGIFTREYLISFYQIAHSRVMEIADLLPNQRDRLATKGTLGYARAYAMPSKIPVKDRELAKELSRLEIKTDIKLPRAIKFTGALYTIGLPPEFIGTGRGLRKLEDKLGEEVLDRFLTYYYKTITNDLKFACRYLNLKVAKSFLPNFVINQVRRDVEYACDMLGIEPEEDEEYMEIMERLEPYLKYMLRDKEKLLDIEKEVAKVMTIKLGILRKSLG